MRGMYRGARLAAVVMVAGGVLLVGSGCATTVTGSAQQPQAQSSHPQDRNMQAVNVALRQIDACKLFDLDLAYSRGNPDATALPTGPHSCMLFPSKDNSPDTEGIEVAVGDKSDLGQRYAEQPMTIADAKAYQEHDESHCRIDVPVSFTRSIAFQYRTHDNSDTCSVLKAYTEPAVHKLANPDALT
ncbi:MAG: hypothetical protein ACRDQZ_10510, partial [Mycobacteriales bacterium]